MMCPRHARVGLALAIVAIGARPAPAHAQWALPRVPVQASERPALATLATELASLAAGLPVVHEQRFPLLDAASKLRLELGDTTVALAIGAMAPPRVLVAAERELLCTMLDRGDADGALAFADGFTPRVRRDGAVAAIARVMAGRRRAADSAAPFADRARRMRALALAEALGDPALRLDAIVLVGVTAHNAGDTVVARAALERARVAWRALADTVDRARGARDVAWLVQVVAPAESAAWRGESGVAWGDDLPRERERAVTRATAHDSAIARAGAGDLAGALRVARRVRDRYGAGVRAETLLGIASAAAWHADQQGAAHPAARRDTVALVLRMAAREAAGGRVASTRDELLRRIAEAQLGAGRYDDAARTANGVADWRERGAVASRVQGWVYADSGYRVFVAGLSDARSRDVVRLQRLRIVRRVFTQLARADAAAVVDSLESSAMHPVGALVMQLWAGADTADPAAVRAAVLALQDSVVDQVELDSRALRALLPAFVEWAQLAPDAAGRRERALRVAEMAGRAHDWRMGRWATFGCLH